MVQKVYVRLVVLTVVFLKFQILRKRKIFKLYRGADKSLARSTSRCILFDGENISFEASLVSYIYIYTYIYIYIYIYIYSSNYVYT